LIVIVIGHEHTTWLNTAITNCNKCRGKADIIKLLNITLYFPWIECSSHAPTQTRKQQTVLDYDSKCCQGGMHYT